MFVSSLRCGKTFFLLIFFCSFSLKILLDRYNESLTLIINASLLFISYFTTFWLLAHILGCLFPSLVFLQPYFWIIIFISESIFFISILFVFWLFLFNSSIWAMIQILLWTELQLSTLSCFLKYPDSYICLIPGFVVGLLDTLERFLMAFC